MAVLVSTITTDSRGRRRIYLGKGHPYANSGGWQWLARYLLMVRLGRRLERWEHAHHRDRDRANDRARNLRVLEASAHSRLHAAEMTATGRRGTDGRFRRITS